MESEISIRCLLDGLRTVIDLPPDPDEDPTNDVILNSVAQALEWVLGESRSEKLAKAFDALALTAAIRQGFAEKSKKGAPHFRPNGAC